MVDALGGFGPSEEAERGRLADTASIVSATCLSQTTVAAASAIIRIVQPDQKRGALGEPAADLRQIRTDPRLMVTLRRDLDVAEGQVRFLIADALWIGFRTGATNRAKTMGVDGLKINVDLTEEDRADLVGYPILGLTSSEWAQSLRRQLEEAVNRALAIPLTAGIDPATIPPALAEVAHSHATRVAGAVEEAHAAGCQAALRAIGAALVGAA